MAISKDKKEAIVAKLTDQLKESKVTIFAEYAGLSVGDMQELRAQAVENDTSVVIAKNRLVKVAAKQVDELKDVDLSNLKGQLMLATSSQDEVAPAQTLDKFSKAHPQVKMVGGFDNTGSVLDEAAVKQLASLPSKDQLRGQLVGTIAAPLSGLVNVMAGNMRGLVNVLNARAKEIEG